MQVEVLNIQGKSTGEKVELNDAVFAIEPNDHAIYMDVRLMLDNARQGTHKIKERGEVSGSTKKPYKQKGTGNARQGHKRSPLHRHGGTIHGPKPHDYGYKLNKKVKRLARKSALSLKAKDNKIMVLDSISFGAPKTKEFAGVLANLKLDATKVLFVLPVVKKYADEEKKQVTAQYTSQIDNVVRSGRNLPKLNIMSVGELNTYDILNAEHVVMLKEAVATVNTTLI